MHEGVEAFVGIFMAFEGEMEVDHGGFELGVPQVALDEPGIDTRFEQMGGVGMPEGMNGHPSFGHPSTMFGCAAGTLDTGATHGRGCRRALLVITPSSGKEPGGVTVGFPVGSQQREGRFGQGDIPVFGALTAVDMDLEALAINVGDLKGECLVEPQSQAIDGGEVDLIVQGSGGLEETPDFLHPEDGREPVWGLSPKQRQGVPITLKDVLVEEADAAVAEAHGSRGETIDVFAVQEVMLKLLFREQVGRFTIKLSQ